MSRSSPCPHCKDKFVRLDQHLLKCPVEPGSYARLLAFIAEISDGKYLPSVAVYNAQVRASGADVPTVSALCRCFGTWGRTAEALGMQLKDSVPTHDKETVWAALRQWFDIAEPPFISDGWDTWAEENGQPSAKKIIRFFDIPWRYIIEEMAYSKPYPIRDEEKQAQDYVGTGFQVARSYEAVYSRGGQTYREVRHVLR